MEQSYIPIAIECWHRNHSGEFYVSQALIVAKEYEGGGKNNSSCMQVPPPMRPESWQITEYNMLCIVLTKQINQSEMKMY